MNGTYVGNLREGVAPSSPVLSGAEGSAQAGGQRGSQEWAQRWTSAPRAFLGTRTWGPGGPHLLSEKKRGRVVKTGEQEQTQPGRSP